MPGTVLKPLSVGSNPRKLQTLNCLTYKIRYFLLANLTLDSLNLHNTSLGKGITSFFFFWMVKDHSSGQFRCLLRAAWAKRLVSCSKFVLSDFALGPTPGISKSIDLDALLSNRLLRCTAFQQASSLFSGEALPTEWAASAALAFRPFLAGPGAQCPAV